MGAGVSLLRISGLVQAPQSFDFAALRALDCQQREPSMLLGGREIVAVPLERLLARAGIDPRARTVVAESADGAFISVLPVIAVEGCVVVYRVGDAPLPRPLGGPLRLVTHGHLGCGDVKDLGVLFVSDQPFVDGTESGRIALRRISPEAQAPRSGQCAPTAVNVR
jgi:DMSO/TMAO reductase YedYZ molybdopterin-dependent catalytic subunit